MVFDDPNFLIEEDHVTEEGEERLHAIGTVNGLTMLVVHTYRKTKDDKEIVRIISARAASKKEFKRYFQQAAK